MSRSMMTAAVVAALFSASASVSRDITIRLDKPEPRPEPEPLKALRVFADEPGPKPHTNARQIARRRRQLAKIASRNSQS